MEPNMRPMLHEMLHYLDQLRGEPTANHENWDIKGYLTAAHEFESTLEEPWIQTP